MINEKKYFSDEYSIESSTEDSNKEAEIQQIKREEFEIEQGKYGDSKPKRIIIKAKIIND